MSYLAIIGLNSSNKLTKSEIKLSLRVGLNISTGPNQTWEIGRVRMKTRRYVGNREEKNHYGIWKTAEFNMFCSWISKN